MGEFRKTDEFADWLKKLKDKRGKANILERIKRAEEGDFGDCKWHVRDGVSEMRIHSGPGYRLYFCKMGEAHHLLLVGDTKKPKNEQTRDMDRAFRVKKEELGE